MTVGSRVNVGNRNHKATRLRHLQGRIEGRQCNNERKRHGQNGTYFKGRWFVCNTGQWQGEEKGIEGVGEAGITDGIRSYSKKRGFSLKGIFFPYSLCLFQLWEGGGWAIDWRQDGSYMLWRLEQWNRRSLCFWCLWNYHASQVAHLGFHFIPAPNWYHNQYKLNEEKFYKKYPDNPTWLIQLY